MREMKAEISHKAYEILKVACCDTVNNSNANKNLTALNVLRLEITHLEAELAAKDAALDKLVAHVVKYCPDCPFDDECDGNISDARCKQAVKEWAETPEKKEAENGK